MIRSLVMCVVIAIMPFTSVLAAASSGGNITVTQQIGSDTTPPSVPTNVVATPVTSSQINLTWTAATDTETGVDAYQVFRDALQIATTSTTTYSDTSLTASTTYAYTVAAVDRFDNISARSATTSTSTLAAPIVPPTEEEEVVDAGRRSGSNVGLPKITELEIETTNRSAQISFATPWYTRATLRYGTTPQYEIATIARETFQKGHSIQLNDLEPGVQYYFIITIVDQNGDTAEKTATFITIPEVDKVPPENVRNLEAEVRDTDVQLSWDNPVMSDFDRVRVVANRQFYPTDPTDGRLVYEGSQSTVVDQAALTTDDHWFYTVYTYDAADNVSSGAIVFVQAPSVLPDQPVDPLTEEPADTINPILQALDFSDVEFIQNNRVKVGLQSQVQLDPHQPVTVRVPYEKMPERLKAITLSMVDPDDSNRIFSVLLRINDSQEYYEATIAPLERSAEFQTTLSVFDFSTRKLTSVSGVVSTIPQTDQAYPDAPRTVFEQFMLVASRYWWWWIIIMFLLLFAYWYSTKE